MFNQDSATVNMSIKADTHSLNSQQKEVSELSQVYDRISKLNVEYQSILYEVEEKLHSIKNLRTPDKSINDVRSDKDVNGINDFISAVNQQLEIFAQYNSRLQRVLKHCSSII